MSTTTKTNTPIYPINKNKSTYTSPHLVKYGEVRILTQSGTRNQDENTGSKRGPTYKLSDRLNKYNIVKIGMHPLGIGLYLFDYKMEDQDKWGYGRQFGVMADEVETVIPEAVLLHPDGYKMVNYGLLGVNHTIH